MRILGDFEKRQFEVHLNLDWIAEAFVRVEWIPDLEKPIEKKRAWLYLRSWHFDGDQVPIWLREELDSQQSYILEVWGSHNK